MHVNSDSSKSDAAFKKYKKQARGITIGFSLLCVWKTDLLCNTQNAANTRKSCIFKECSGNIDRSCFNFLYCLNFDVEIQEVKERTVRTTSFMLK